MCEEIMKPIINSTKFGSIIIDKNTYYSDVIIKLDGNVVKRNKNLSREVTGTSHKVSLQEIRSFYEQDAKTIVIGSGQYGILNLTQEAKDFLNENDCELKIQSTPEAIRIWNDSSENVIGLFHVTC